MDLQCIFSGRGCCVASKFMDCLIIHNNHNQDNRARLLRQLSFGKGPVGFPKARESGENQSIDDSRMDCCSIGLLG